MILHSKKTILLTTTVVGTANRFLAPLIEALVENGWDVHVACSPGDLRLHGRAAECSFHAIPMTRSISPASDLVSGLLLTRLVLHLKPDVIVGGTPKAATLSMLAGWLVGTPHRIFRVQGARWDGMKGRSARLLRFTDKLTVALATETVAVSNSLADLMVSSGITRRRPTVIGWGGSKGVDMSRFIPARTDPQRRPVPTLGFVGRLSVDKGIGDLFSCFQLCRNQNPETKLIVVGQVDAAQPIGAHLLANLHSEGVTWIEQTEDVPTYLQQMSCLVFPSRREGLPNVVIEAAACGVPTAGYSVTGLTDTVLEGVSGHLVDLGDVESLATAALALSQNTPRVEARQMVQDRFSSEFVISGFVAFLERRVTRGRRRPSSLNR